MDQQTLLKRLLPHREPMILLEEMVALEGNSATAALQVSTDSAFYRTELGGVPSWVGIEYMAQTIAAWSGEQMLKQDKPISIGFLLGSRRYQAETPVFIVGTRLEISISAVYLEASGLSSFDCDIMGWPGCQRHTPSDGNQAQVLASARINAFRPEDYRAFVRDGMKV